jgi:cyclase
MQVVRVIPCLDVNMGRVVKGVKFVEIKDAGDPVELAALYDKEGADELVFLDITASYEERKIMIEVVEKVASNIFIPFTVGGGISELNSAKDLLRAGADKVAVNTSAVKNPNLISALAEEFGSQCVVLAVDAKKTQSSYEVFINGGRTPTGIDAITWIEDGVKKGAGEILITSIDQDGTQLGYETALIREIASRVQVPIIASGGVGELIHFIEGAKAGASGLLAASVFHYGMLSISEVKRALIDASVPVRP